MSAYDPKMGAPTQETGVVAVADNQWQQHNTNVAAPASTYTPANQGDLITMAPSNQQHATSFIEPMQPQPGTNIDGREVTNQPLPAPAPVYTNMNNNNTTTIDTIGGPLYVVPLDRLGETPEWIDCPFCQKPTKTRVSHADSTATTLAGVLCCLVCICAACVPCLCGWCQDTDHFCSECNRQVTHKPHDGAIQRMQPPSEQYVPSKYGMTTRPPGTDMNMGPGMGMGNGMGNGMGGTDMGTGMAGNGTAPPYEKSNSNMV